MKNHLLVTAALLTGISAVAQNAAKPSGSTNHFKNQAKALYFSKKENFVARPASSQLPNSPLAANSTTATWNPISSSINIYGVLIDGQKPLHYNPYVNAVSFVHRKSPTYTASPDNNSGAIVAMISNDWGTTWDSTCIYSDGTNLARYPQGAIYSAPGNTLLSNAYIVGSGIVTDGSNFIGSWYASKQLGTGNYNAGASSVPNAMQFMPNFAPFGTAGKDDYASYSFSSSNDGKVRSLGYYCVDVNAVPTDLRGFKINTGTFNAGIFNWTGDSIMEATVNRTDGTKHLGFTPIMAWSENGMTGYMISIGVKAGTTGSNRGYQPIIEKTTNGGTSWSLLSGIDFSSPTYSTILNRLSPVPNSTVVVPQFNSLEGIDAAVDMNGNLHLACLVNSTASMDVDSLDYSSTFTSENYSWPFSAGKQPYLYDFYGDGSAAWKYTTIDSLTSEGPSDQSTGGGFNDNPWDIDAGTKVRSGSRIQLSRTPDGKFIIYTWAESNPAFTIGGKTWNTLPDVKARLMDVTNVGGAGLYSISPTKLNLTPVGTAVNGKAMFHFAAPKSSVQSYTSGTTASFTLPVTVTNSNPYSQLTANTHWYSTAKLDFVLSSVGVKENSLSEITGCSLFPNPSNGNVTLTVDLKANTQVDVTVYNVIGKEIKNIKGNCNGGSNNINLDLNGLSKGIYLINIKAGNTLSTKKLIIE